MSILLINPPFSMPDKPYISIPQLAAYLDTQGIKVFEYDSNLEIFHRLLEVNHLKKSREYANERFLYLSNRKKHLTKKENVEKRILDNLLDVLKKTGTDFKHLFDENIPSSTKFNLFQIYISLATIKYFPEHITFTLNTNYLRYSTQYSKFSSAAILESCKKNGLIHDFLTDSLLNEIVKLKPILIGLSVAFPDQIIPAMQIAAIIKKKRPEIHICLGGAFVSSHMRELKNNNIFSFIDSLILDDGEIPLTALYKKLITKSKDLTLIPQLVFLSNNKIKYQNSKTGCLIQPNSIPDYRIVNLKKYLINIDNMALLYRLSHGCYWAHCSFCKTDLPMVKEFYNYNLVDLYQKIKTNVLKDGVKIFSFTDDATDWKTLRSISEMILKDKLNISWVSSVRCETDLTTKNCVYLRGAGCRSLYMGIESYNNRILRLMHKGISVDRIDKVISNISWSGINLYIYMIVGFPTETEEEAVSSFDKIKKLKEEGLIKDAIYNVFEIHPYSDIWKNHKHYGIKSINYKKGFDLLPPLTKGFSAPGMSRKKAINLSRKFTKELMGLGK